MLNFLQNNSCARFGFLMELTLCGPKAAREHILIEPRIDGVWASSCSRAPFGPVDSRFEMYAKIFSSILTSSIWFEPDATRIVWFTLLLSMDEDGFAHFASVEVLAHVARVDVTLCNVAVTVLESPDPNSSSDEHEGRRIERVPGGWMILNASKYRGLSDAAKLRESTRLRVKRFRDKQKGNVTVTDESLRNVLPVSVSECTSASSSKGVQGDMPEENYVPRRTPSVAEQTKAHGMARIVIGKLNQLTGSRYREIGDGMDKVAHRLIDTNFDLDGIVLMLERQVKLWRGDARASQGLNPSTLFGEKFENYYGQRATPIPQEIHHNGKPQIIPDYSKGF